MEAAQAFVNGWLEEQNVVYACNGILFSLEKKGKYDTIDELKDTMLKHKYSMLPLIWDS